MPRLTLPGSPHRALAVVGACLALAVTPAAALAQSAGDEQYADPLAGQDQKDSGSGAQGGSGNSGSTAGQAPGTSQASAPTSTAQTTPATPAAAPSGQLARTGTDVLPPALAGGLLLMAGGALLALAGPRVRRRRGEPTVLFDGTLPPLR